jgi:hypothetical protein
MNNKEKGAASIIVTMENGKLKVIHESTWDLLHERDADAGIWDAIWDVIKNYKSEKKFAWTHMVGTEEERDDFIKEWEELLNVHIVSAKSIYGWRMEAYVTDKQVEMLNMESDWIIHDLTDLNN